LAIRSLVQLRGFIESLPGGSVNIAPIDIQNNTPPQAALPVILLAGDNTIPTPDLAKGAIIIFAPTSVTVKKLKGIAGDTGIIVSKNSWCVLTFDTPNITSFIINSGALDTGLYTNIIFF
jgi:hypothetical protein